MTFTPAPSRASAFALSCCLAWVASTSAQTSQTPPALAVAIVVDQMRADYLERFRPYLAEGGFLRLLEEGAVFAECRYAHAVTKTAPGHATLLSGSHPDVHGILANEWIDPSTWRALNSVEDPECPLVGNRPRAWRSPAGVLEAREGRSPRNFEATTVGDQLKIRHGSGSRVIAASIKDRSAILMGGKQADGAYWVEKGRFVTSTYYCEQLPDWVESFNERGEVEATLGRTWDRLLSPEVYDAVQGPDDAAGESARPGLDTTFPHRIDGGTGEIGDEFYDAWYVSPFSNELLVAFAQAAIAHEKLGRHTATDLLCLSFSQIDGIGHAMGPDSHEMMDSMLRLDRSLAELFAFIDDNLGLERCLIVVSSDHGCAPLPERVNAAGSRAILGQRVTARETTRIVAAALARAFGSMLGPMDPMEQWLLADNEGYRLNARQFAGTNIPLAEARRVVKEALLSVGAIQTAFTREEILGLVPVAHSPLLEQVRRGFPPERGQDVVFVYKPYRMNYVSGGSTHGTPWDYDSHVPLLFLGRDVPAGLQVEPVQVVDLAPTLAALLQVPPPPQSQGRRLF